MTHTARLGRAGALFALVCAVVLLGLTSPASGSPGSTSGSTATAEDPDHSFKPLVEGAAFRGETAPLRELQAPRTKAAPEIQVMPRHPLPKATDSKPGSGSTRVQNQFGGRAPAPAFPGAEANFEGVGNLDGVLPPDTNGDVGPNYYVQWINLHFAVFDKDSGEAVLGPLPGNTFWSGLGGPCGLQNDGDPIAKYDALAGRWMVSQFALFAGGGDDFYQCIAVSQTGDPTGSWYQYAFQIPDGIFNDYPKFGVWPDAYYMTVNEFNTSGTAFLGAGAAAFERDAMLQGLPARMVYFDLNSVNPSFGGQLPGDADGTPPPSGAPNVFAEMDDDTFGIFPTDRVSLWDFHVDWTNPANSTFGDNGQPNQSLETASFDSNLCNYSRSCIGQPDTGQGLDAIADRLMYRLQYRNFGDHQTLVLNHSVDVDGSDHAGVRWYELRNTGSGWGIHQQGTYAPDADNRWMASAAMDASGNIALGYSVSSESTYPSIRMTGRLADDPPGLMPQGEGELIAGSGSQTHFAGRWGDYSSMSVDPTDGCTFWYTSEYMAQTSSADWQTRIGSFRFPSCTSGPSGTLEGTVTDADTGDPVPGAFVEAGASSTVTDEAGHYSMTLPVGTYDMTATAYGYGDGTASGVEVADGQTTTQDFALDPLPSTVVTGTVTDGGGHGWPLHARVDVVGAPVEPAFTDPVTGEYSVRLLVGETYTLQVHSFLDGYVDKSRDVTVTDNDVEDFALDVDSAACIAPGYSLQGGITEAFSSGETPPGWTVVDNLGNGQVWTFDDPGNRGNLTGGEDGFAIMDSDHYGSSGHQDTSLVSPVIDLSDVASPLLIFKQDYNNLGDIADVDVSVDGGATWTTKLHQTTDARGPATVTLDVPEAGGQPDVQVRFHNYEADWDWWWEVDDVRMGASCQPVAGGLLVGQVTAAATGDPINGADVVSDDHPQDATKTAATAEDPNLGDGFYTLFSSLTGSHPFTASFGQFQPQTEDVDVVADDVVAQDFALAAGHLVVQPDSLQATVPMGSTATRQLTITNDGAAPASYELGERGGDFQILGQEGAPLQRIKAPKFQPYSPLSVCDAGEEEGGGENPCAEGDGDGDTPKRPTASAADAPNAPPWADIADYPTAVMDNVNALVDGKLYSFTGISGLTWLDDTYIYDPDAGEWTDGAPIGTAREKPEAAEIDGKVYVVGGWDSSGATVDSLEIYDTQSDSWSTGAPVPTAWAGGTAVALNGTMYVIGGCADTCGSTDVFAYDPGSDSWSQVADYPVPVAWSACGAISGSIYCAGGTTAGDQTLTSTYAYDPGSDSWTERADLPIDLWASGFTAANGLLLVSGGVTDGFATLTNQGFAYDPSADSWSALPNSNNTRYRGGSACGFYKVGGSSGGFTADPASEVLPGFTDCASLVDVPWLSEDPTSGTLAPGESATVTVTLDASVAEVNQPGDYTAQVVVNDDTPFTVAPVGVTMTVPVPRHWGELTGTVTGETCDGDPIPLGNAIVQINAPDVDVTLQTDANGRYDWWLMKPDGNATLVVSRDGYIPQTRDVKVKQGGSTVTDFTLRRVRVC